MPPTNDPKHRHAKPESPARRKTKPKFEIPVETGLSQAPVGWVYRADEAPVPPQVTSAPAEESVKPSPFLVAGMGMFFISVGTLGLVSLAALGLFAAPMRMARRLLN